MIVFVFKNVYKIRLPGTFISVIDEYLVVLNIVSEIRLVLNEHTVLAVLNFIKMITILNIKYQSGLKNNNNISKFSE